MSALPSIRAPYIERAQPYADTYRAWKAGTDASYPLPTNAANLGEVVADVCGRCAHKDTLIVLHADRDGKQTLHLFTIRQKAPIWVRDELAGTKQVRPLYADKLLAMRVDAFDPTEPFRWTPGCDVVGHNTLTIEVQS